MREPVIFSASPFMLRQPIFAALLAASASLAPGQPSTRPEQPLSSPVATPLFAGLGAHTRKVTTNSALAQQYFDQGLNFVFGFNDGAAIRSFQAAARLDPKCAMAHWGIALACGPNINAPTVPPSAAALAWRELSVAREHAAKASIVEQDLINALGSRYIQSPREDRRSLDLAYTAAMRKVWNHHPRDADVGALFADSMMDLRPWDQWTSAGLPQPGTEEVISTLDAVLALDLQHPLANHLYIHAFEASRHPERALPAADRLSGLQPGLAHNVHMPSHIYIRVGRWQDAVLANLKAVEADRQYRLISGGPDGFLGNYIAHDQHMLAYAAMMTGQSQFALEHIRAMVSGLSEDFRRDYAASADVFLAMPFEVMIRFGKWDDILAAPDLPNSMPMARAMRRAARGIAFAAKGDAKSARSEQAAFLSATEAIPPQKARRPKNTAGAFVHVVAPMLEGEISYREGNIDAGLAQLRAAAKAEDELHYDEPPDWLLPVRHSLGASLMAAGRFAEAEQVYRDDLARLPENGWSLFGLARALRLQKKNLDEATAIEARFNKIWANADLDLTSSCLCQPGD
jgi:tetratricopeptide (TPR) repeat protein